MSIKPFQLRVRNSAGFEWSAGRFSYSDEARAAGDKAVARKPHLVGFRVVHEDDPDVLPNQFRDWRYQ